MSAVLALGWPVLVFLFCTVFVAALLQRLAGQGFGLIATPLFALAAPEYLPATILLLGFVVGLSASALDFSAVEPRELPPGFAGRLVGAVIAAWIATQLNDPSDVAIVVTVAIYVGIFLTVAGVSLPIRPLTLFSAGTVAGVMGTLVAVGAPPMAIVYSRTETRKSVAMQNTFFVWGMMVSIPALAFVGLVGIHHLKMALVLLPAVGIALLVVGPLARRFAKQSIRPWALGLSGAAATVLLVRALTG